MRHPIVIPDLGATGGDVRIVSWTVREGQTVEEGETLFTVETDKAVTEIHAFRGGALVSISVAAGQNCAPGAVVAYLADEAEAGGGRSSAATPSARKAHIKLRAEAPPSDALGPTVESLVQAFSTMTLIRRYEEHLYQLFLQGLVPGTLHQCQGQEAVAVGVCSALRARRPDLQHAPAGRTSHRQGRVAQRHHRGNLGQGDRLRRRQGRPDAPGRFLGRRDGLATPSSAPTSRSRPAAPWPSACSASTASRSASSATAPRISAPSTRASTSPRCRARPVDLRLREQSLRRLDPYLARHAHHATSPTAPPAYGMPGVVVDGMDVEAVYRGSGRRRSRGREPATVRR